MLSALLKGILGRLLAYAVLGLGFWLLQLGFVRPQILLAVLGGAMILAGMYLMVTAKKISLKGDGDAPQRNRPNGKDKLP